MRGMKPYSALVFAAASWGVATAGAKYAVQKLGPFTTLVIEVGMAAAVLWVAMLIVRPKRTLPLRGYV